MDTRREMTVVGCWFGMHITGDFVGDDIILEYGGNSNMTAMESIEEDALDTASYTTHFSICRTTFQSKSDSRPNSGSSPL